MKIYAWVEVWPGAKQDDVRASGYPPSYPIATGNKRYRIEVEIPDPPTLAPVDAVIHGVVVEASGSQDA